MFIHITFPYGCIVTRFATKYIATFFYKKVVNCCHILTTEKVAKWFFKKIIFKKKFFNNKIFNRKIKIRALCSHLIFLQKT